MENQRDYMHIVSKYYPDGNLTKLVMEQINLSEELIRDIAMSILATITYCHKDLGIIISNLNPEHFVIDRGISKSHTRLVNMNHFINKSWARLTVKEMKRRLSFITNTGQSMQGDENKHLDLISFQALFLAPEQILFS